MRNPLVGLTAQEQTKLNDQMTTWGNMGMQNDETMIR